jgi:hypothetical protein
MNNLFQAEREKREKERARTSENVLLRSILIRAVETSHLLQPLSSPGDRFFFLITFRSISFGINNGLTYRLRGARVLKSVKYCRGLNRPCAAQVQLQIREAKPERCVMITR